MGSSSLPVFRLAIPRIPARSLLLREIGLVVALLVCGILALRPIPSITAPNDTGRYVASYEATCQIGGSTELDRTLPQRFFDLLSQPTCWTAQPRIWLIILSMAVPLALLWFGSWNRDSTLLLFFGFLCSCIGFELMTNALRQGVSLAFLLAALCCKRKSVRLLAIGAALLLHDSAWAFLPQLLFLNRWSFRIRTAKMRSRSWLTIHRANLASTVSAIVLGGIAACLLVIRFEALGSVASLLNFYLESYSMEATKLFVVFMILPVCWTFAVRLMTEKSRVTKAEWLTFLYSLVVFTTAVAFFPAITYRFTLTALVLQLLMAMRAPRLSLKSASLIALGLAAHFVVFAVFSNNVRAVIHG